MATGITSESEAINPTVHAVTTYTYNYLNQLVSTTDPQGKTTTNSYDKLGNLTGVTDKSGGTASYTYDELNRLTSVVNGGDEISYLSPKDDV